MVIEVRGRADGLVARDIDGEVLLLDTVVDRVHQLNVSASLIWRMCANGASVEEIVDSLALEFGLTDNDAQRDVDVALEQFRELGLVR